MVAARTSARPSASQTTEIVIMAYLGGPLLIASAVIAMWRCALIEPLWEAEGECRGWTTYGPFIEPAASPLQMLPCPCHVPNYCDAQPGHNYQHMARGQLLPRHCTHGRCHPPLRPGSARAGTQTVSVSSTVFLAPPLTHPHRCRLRSYP